MKKLVMLVAVLAVVLMVAGHNGEGQLNRRRSRTTKGKSVVARAGARCSGTR